jgi:hypothetical protein
VRACIALARHLRLAFVGGALATFAGGGCSCEADPIVARTVVLRAFPATVDLGTVPLLSQTEDNVIVANSGNAAWEPSSPPRVEGDGFAWLGGCDAPVAPNATCTARIRFAPVAEAPHSGILTFAPAADGEEPTVVSLSGVGSAPTVALDPPVLDFGDVLVGQSATLVARVENRGVESLTVPLVLGGAFVLADGAREAGVFVAAGGTVDVDVVFAPASSGPAVGSARAPTCGPACGPLIELRGRSTSPRIDVQPRRLDLGAVAVGSTGTATLVVTNVGDGPLDLQEVTVGGDTGLTLAAAVAARTLAPGASFDVAVAFTPTQGTVSVDGSITLRSSDPVSPNVFVPIGGSAPGPGLDVRPPQGHLGFLDPDEQRDLSIVARASGDAPVHIDEVRLVGGLSAFFLVGAPTATVLAPGAALQFFVRGRADPGAVAAGGASARVLLRTAELGERVVDVAFAAGTSGCVPRPVISHVALGAVRVGEQAGGEAVIENVGDAPCSLVAIAGADTLGLPVDDEIPFNARGLRSLEPGASGGVHFSFAPTNEDAVSAVVTVTFAERDEPVFVSASGRGVRGGLVAVPTAVELGPVAQGCAGPEGNSLLLNDGGALVEVTSVTITPTTGPISVAALPLPLSLLPGASTPLVIRGDGDVAPGVYEASIVATSAAGDATVRVTLTVAASDATLTERFVASEVSAVDILFIVDNSGSMADDQELLAQNFASFFSAGLSDRDVDFQVGVTTTDVLSPGAAAGELVGPVLNRFTADLESTFAEQVRVGDQGSGIELGLEALRLALEDPGRQNLFRDHAALSVVFVTDEEDTGAFPEFLPDPALSRDPDEYVALLEAKKGGGLVNAPVLVSAVVTPGSATRYEVLVDHFGGTSLDITRADWGEELGDIGVDTFTLGRAFVLASSAVEDSIVVEVDGRRIVGFRYDAERRAVILNDPPRGGAEIVITYRAECS